MNEISETDGEDTSEPGYVPIRVISQRSGVNSVTLRAWERRYGLLKPVRTPKGHRLYSEDDIARVVRILDWINRGVSIGRVRGLLDRETQKGTAGAQDESPLTGENDTGEVSDWQRYNARLLNAVSASHQNKLDDTADEALSLYPFATVCDRLLNPLEKTLHARWHGGDKVPGNAAESAFYEGYLRRKLAARVQFDARQVNGAPVLIASLPGTVNLVALRTLAVGCIGRAVPVLLLEDALPAEDLIVAGERRRPAAILLHGEVAQEASAFARFIAKVVAAGLAPVAFVGAAARIHEKIIIDNGAIALTEDALAAAVRRLPL